MPGSITATWYSAGVLRTATDDGAGKITGAATGVVDYPSNTVLMRPAFLPDPGGEISVAYTTDLVHTEILGLVSLPDAGGFIPITLAQQPAAGSLSLEWVTARAVSNTAGGSQTTTSAIKNADVTYTTRSVPEYYEPAAVSGGSVFVNWPRSTPGP